MNVWPYRYVRPASSGEIPRAEPQFVDVHLLDMNHRYANAGHDSIVGLVQRLTGDFAPALHAAGLTVRLISYDVRDKRLLPAHPHGDGLSLYIGTGGPGHLDPRENVRDSVDEGLIAEDDAWEGPLFDLFGAIEEDDGAMLYAVCHSFGLLCRWSGVAQPSVRSAEKGGPSIGIVDVVLTPQARVHPWFSRLAEHLPDGVHVPVVDSRHYDLIPLASGMPAGIVPIAYETSRGSEATGDAIVMCEFARRANGHPRVFGVNHHPEIPDSLELDALLRRKFDAGEVDEAWYRGRASLVERLQRDDHSEPARLLGAGYSFTFLVRDALRDAIADRRSGRGRSIPQAL